MFPPPFELIECIDLFNILNAEINGLARISDTNYLYLLDCRSRKEYDESHIISANHIRRNEDGQYDMPWRADLETREHIVLYDSRTNNLPLKEQDEIYICASLLQQHVTALTTIRIVKGGFQLFSKLYPFLRTSQSLYSPKELELIQTYPNEICPNLVYLGRRQHAVNSQIVKDLKIRAYVNCTKHEDYLVQGGDTRKYCRVSIDDVHDADNIFELLHDAVNFISVAYDRGDPVLVYSDRGVSRSAAVIVAFISFQMRMSSQQALKYVEKHRPIRPQQSFIACIDNLNEKLQELKEAMSNVNQISIDDDNDEQASH
ncbi:unnamed protein product [Rotaria socialis]|uniref:protein-tyrosine-phosphatase n=1 Tax=Rotaria socialis TaxID=392032 RepID=A0A818L5A4_9BILA|nr:unnamed protein product [Rotaria socialis]CAF3567256.1 unnamed protein product [Rotaria socialis]CAF4129888.1 unnamed protein product [Rotaria socialis]CAF4429421.1 unnamed protein product [Rotaria socialis]